MRNLSLLGSLVATASALTAQCVAPTSLATQLPFTASHYLGSPNPAVVPDPGFCLYWDMTVQAGVTISSIDTYLYDDGLVNVSQIGNTAPVGLWIVTGGANPTTHTGHESTPGDWTQIGAGTCLVQSSSGSGHSPITFSTPVTLSPGTYGVALNIQETNAGPLPPYLRLHPLITLLSAVPSTPLTASDQFLGISNETYQRIAPFNPLTPPSGVGAVATINIQIFYTAAANSAYYTNYGVGCYFRPQSFYEYFTAPPAFDLSNQGMTLVPLGAGPSNYTVVPGSATIVPHGATPLVGVGGITIMGDDDVSAPQAMPFTFNAPGGVSTSQVVVGSNGTVWLAGVAGSSFGFYDDVARFLNDGPRFALAFGDWETFNPAIPEGGGEIYYDVDPSNSSVRITWDNVQEWNAPTAHLNAQLELYNDNHAEIRYGACNGSAAPILTGYSASNGTGDPGNRNLSNGTNILTFVSGDGQTPSRIGMSARPVIGTTTNIVTTNIQPSTVFSILALSFGSSPGFGLGGFAMPGCVGWVALPVASSSFGPVIAGVHTAPLAIPNVASYNGIQLYGQSAPLTAGLNAAGIVVSNALCMHVGLQ